MNSNTRAMPMLMKRLHQLRFDYLNGRGIDFEPYQAFLPVEETHNWFKAWTGNANVDAKAYLIFGQDGTGGRAAIWLQRENQDLLQQPIVFFGSEGDLGVVARNFSQYLWLLASGHGPYEAVTQPDDTKIPNQGFLEFAKRHTTSQQNKPSEILATARAESPDFEANVLALCR